MSSDQQMNKIALIGCGSIGISFAALYLRHTTAQVCLYDPRPDLDGHVRSILPLYLESLVGGGDGGASSTSTTTTPPPQPLRVDDLLREGDRLRLCGTLGEACEGADVVQEQGPERVEFKAGVWGQVVRLAGRETHLWSSTSGIPASAQVDHLSSSSTPPLQEDELASLKARLLVVHPFNPPHIMPLLELVPSPSTSPPRLLAAQSFFLSLHSGHRPVTLRKEAPGFVGNRLAFALLREACHLVSSGVVSAADLDAVVEASLGPRWAVAGPFRSYNMGGGVGGIGAFFGNLSGTIGEVWADAGVLSFEGSRFGGGKRRGGDGEDKAAAREGKEDVVEEKHWADIVVEQTVQAYGLPSGDDFTKRDEALKTLLRSIDPVREK